MSDTGELEETCRHGVLGEFWCKDCADARLTRSDDYLLFECRRELSSAQSTIAQQKEDLDRISAEREAYREALGMLVYDKDGVPEEWPSREHVDRLLTEEDPNEGLYPQVGSRPGDW